MPIIYKDIERKKMRKEKRKQKKADKNTYYKRNSRANINTNQQENLQAVGSNKSDKQKKNKNAIKQPANEGNVRLQKKAKELLNTGNQEVEGGLQFCGTAARMARLQEFVNRQGNTEQHTEKKTPKAKKSREDKFNDKKAKVAKSQMSARIESLKADQLREISYIKKCERKCGLLSFQKKNFYLTKEYRDDFGDILKDIETGHMDTNKVYENNSEDDLEHDLASALGMQKHTTISKSNDDSEEEASMIDNNEEASMNGDEDSIFDNSDDSCNVDNKRIRDEATDDDNSEVAGGTNKKRKLNISKDEPPSTDGGSEEFHEDIYGRLRDCQGNIISTQTDQTQVYKTPAQRKLDELNKNKGCDETLLIFKRQLKGLLNRLTDANMQGVSNQIEAMYKKNSRNNINDAMTVLLFDSIAKAEPVPNRLIQEHALLISILSANIGCEVGAHILTEFVLRWKDHFDDIQARQVYNDVNSNECENMVAFISYLYMFRIVDSSLIFDILKYLSQSLHLLQVKLILHILRNVGFSLRKSNAIDLKNFITVVQAKGDACKGQDQTYTKLQFLLEVFGALKNNNMSKIPDYNPRHAQHLISVLKTCIRQGCQPSDLNVTLNDLIRSKDMGRWWIVGSAWSDGLKENTVSVPTIQKDTAVKRIASESIYSDQFLEKVQALHFASSPRINIFYALTEGSESRDHIVENILQIRIPRNQTKEIFNVLVFSCMRSLEYLTDYAYVARRLSAWDRLYKRCLKLTLWDKFKELPATMERHISNLANLTGELVCNDGVHVAVFKQLQLINPDPKIVSFMRQTLIVILMDPSGESSVERVFKCLCSTPKLSELRRDIRVFISKFMPPKKDDDRDKKMLYHRTKLALHTLENTDSVYM